MIYLIIFFALVIVVAAVEDKPDLPNISSCDLHVFEYHPSHLSRWCKNCDYSESLNGNDESWPK